MVKKVMFVFVLELLNREGLFFFFFFFFLIRFIVMSMKAIDTYNTTTFTLAYLPSGRRTNVYLNSKQDRLPHWTSGLQGP